MRLALIGQTPKKIESGPVGVLLTLFLPRPKQKGKDRLFPHVRPDLDNYFKLIADAANGILWKDDGQIVEMLVRKLYAADGEQPHSVIRVSEYCENICGFAWDRYGGGLTRA